MKAVVKPIKDICPEMHGTVVTVESAEKAVNCALKYAEENDLIYSQFMTEYTYFVFLKK